MFSICSVNHEKIESHSEKVCNIKPFINKYKREEINCPSKIEEWKRFEKSNSKIALNVLYIKEIERCRA